MIIGCGGSVVTSIGAVGIGRVGGGVCVVWSSRVAAVGVGGETSLDLVGGASCCEVSWERQMIPHGGRGEARGSREAVESWRAVGGGFCLDGSRGAGGGVG